MFQVNMVLPSGRCESLSLLRSSKVGDLNILAQTSFGQGRLTLITAEGHVLLDPLESICAAGLEDDAKNKLHGFALAQKDSLKT